MPYVKVRPVVQRKLRALCIKPYPLHPKGCPNYDHKRGCPPAAPFLNEAFDLLRSCYVVYHAFPLGRHVARMRRIHPEWSMRQLVCCLYWQGRARKLLEAEILRFSRNYPKLTVERCPEAMGLNVTETLRHAGVPIEWPPQEVALTVAFAGHSLLL